MYARRESGEGIARNLASHSRSAFADSAVKPRRSPAAVGVRPSSTTKAVSGASGANERAGVRMRNLTSEMRVTSLPGAPIYQPSAESSRAGTRARVACGSRPAGYDDSAAPALDQRDL